jgi:O-antigen ligase
MVVLLLITGVVLVSGSAIFAIVISLGAISWKYGKKIFINYILAVIFIGSVYPFVMPSKNISAVEDFLSVYEQGSISKNYYRRIALLNDFGKNTLLKKKINRNDLEITSNKLFVGNELDIQGGEAYKEFENAKLIKNRFLEMQASLNLITENTLVGVGAGNFQDNIGAYYNELPKINTSEPGLNCGYLIIASTIGILGLSSLLWIFFGMLRNSLGQINRKANVEHFQIGLYGAIVACMIENMFVYLFSGGMLAPFLFIVYLSFDKKNR